MITVERVREARNASRGAKSRGARVGLVPTMGYLHEGHLALVRRARELAEFVVVSIFVNPTQFGPNEDFERYPRDWERDSDLCRGAGVDLVFAPPVEELYPEGSQTWVSVEELSGPLCGGSRPGHFRGVATVVAKLFHAVEPDVAIFGEKDYQQLQVIRRMARDLLMPVRVEGIPIVREEDGLALSSRNVYLKGGQRGQALALSRALARAQDLVSAGEERVAPILDEVRRVLEGAGVRVEYAEIRHPETLAPVASVRPRAVLALAGLVGATRLIDNRILETPGTAGEEVER